MIDERVYDSYGIISTDVIIEFLREKSALESIFTLNVISHTPLAGEISILLYKGLFTQSGPKADLSIKSHNLQELTICRLVLILDLHTLTD